MARGQGEPPEARQAPALRGQSAGVLMDCQGHEQGYMQGFAEASHSGPCPLLAHALKLSAIAPAAACHCAVASPEATGATVKLRRKLASGNTAMRRRRVTGEAALTALNVSGFASCLMSDGCSGSWLRTLLEFALLCSLLHTSAPTPGRNHRHR